MRRSFSFVLKLGLLAVGFVLLFNSARADIPRLINFQGVLKDSLGNPLPDGNYSLTFRIYNAASSGNILWQEGQLISLRDGLFTYLLGSSVPVPESVFNDTSRWIGIQIGANPEISPRRRLVSSAYAYSALNAAKLSGSDGSDFVRRTGPDSVVSSTGTALRVKSVGSSVNDMAAIVGNANNSGTNDAYGGSFAGIGSGSGRGYGITGYGETNSSLPAYGLAATGANYSDGDAYGGYFTADFGGTGVHYGVFGESFGASSLPTYGSYGSATNPSSGNAYGGRFVTGTSGTGTHYGVYGEGIGTTSTSTYGSYGRANNTSTGIAYGGFFTTTTIGTGSHYGVRAEATGSSSANTIGSYGSAENTSTGSVTGGSFTAIAGGTGTHYGVYGFGDGSSSAASYGTYGVGTNASTGGAYGGFFVATSPGTGVHYGVYGVEDAGGSGAAVYASGDFAGSGAKYAVAKTSQGNRLLSVIESPEVWFEDFGEGQLVNGQAHIELDPLFLETVTINASNPMKVFIQLKDDCKGVYAKTQTAGFDVFELQGGTSDAAFTYRLVAKRKGYETQRLKQTDIGMDDPNLYPELWEKIEKEHQERQAEMEKSKIQN